MFHRIGRAVVRHPVWTIVAWLIATAAIVMTAPSLPSNSDESSFLPSSYQSIKAMDLQQKAFPAAFTPAAIVLYERADHAPLTAADKADITRITTDLAKKKIDQVQKVIAGSPSKDGKYQTALVQMDKKSAGQPKQADAAKALRTDSTALTKGTDLQARVGGQAAQALDQQDAGKSSDAIAFLGSVLIIILTLLVLFRSLIVVVLPLLVLVMVYLDANALIADATKLFGLQANSSVSSLLIVVVLGVGTDYFLFLMFRYRERLRLGDEPKQAMINSVARVGEAIASAAGAVIISFLALTLSTLGFLTQLGPALAILVAVTLIAGLTLFPAICSLIPPRALFWPGKKWGEEPSDARFAAIGRLVGRKSVMVAVFSGLIMVVLALGTFGFKANYDLASGSIPKTKESVVVQDTMQKAYSAGAADPTSVFLSSTDGKPLDAVDFSGFVGKLRQVDGVASASFDQQTGLNKDHTTALFNLTLKYSGASDQAISAVGKVRTAAADSAPPGTEAVVGGTSSIYRDINAAVNHDYRTVFPIAAILIMVILGLLLRSVVAPWYLIASVALGFGATLGATVLIFGRGDGLIFLLPIIMYLFVVAIGTDYNILMIARLREEAREGKEPREAAAAALQHAGPTIASAGFILAATFATLMLGGNAFLVEMGFAIAFGIVVAAFVMAMFFTPSLTALIGHAAWWPGHADRGAEPPSGAVPAGDGAVAGDAHDAPRFDESGRH
jgi:RND superfamily putative drug exporter